MGIHDRDYLKSRHKGGNSGGGALDEALEGLLGDFFLKHKRLVRLVVAIFLLLLACWEFGGICFGSTRARWGAVALIASLLTLPVAGTGSFNSNKMTWVAALPMFSPTCVCALRNRTSPAFISTMTSSKQMKSAI